MVAWPACSCGPHEASSLAIGFSCIGWVDCVGTHIVAYHVCTVAVIVVIMVVFHHCWVRQEGHVR